MYYKFLVLIFIYTNLIADSMNEFVKYEHNGHLGKIDISLDAIYSYNNFAKYREDYREILDIDFQQFIYYYENDSVTSIKQQEVFDYYKCDLKDCDVVIKTEISYDTIVNDEYAYKVNIKIDDLYNLDFALGERKYIIDDEIIFIKINKISLHYAGLITLDMAYKLDSIGDYTEFFIESCFSLPFLSYKKEYYDYEKIESWSITPEELAKNILNCVNSIDDK